MNAGAGQTPVAEVNGLTVRYGRIPALADVTLRIARGEVFALLGRNGAGKSSLVRCLLGQQRPAAGRVELFGADVWRSRTAAMRRVGVVPETPDMPPGMTAAQIEAFCAQMYPDWDGSGVSARLKRFGVPADIAARSLSRGQRALLSLALALGHRPELLVLDDPTLGLDAVARRAVLEEIIDELASRGATVLVTTHDLAGIEGVADRVGILAAGTLLTDEPIEALKHRVRRIVCAPESLPTIPFAVVREDRTAWGLEAVVSDYSAQRFAAWTDGPGAGASAAAIPLEEIFIALVGEGGGRS